MNLNIIGGAMALAFISGAGVNGWRIDAKAKKSAEKAQAKYEQTVRETNEANTALMQELENRTYENVKLTGQLEAARTASMRPYQPIAQAIPSIIPKCDADGSVRYDADFVRVFNQAARAGSPSSGTATSTNPARQLSDPMLAGTPDTR